MPLLFVAFGACACLCLPVLAYPFDVNFEAALLDRIIVEQNGFESQTRAFEHDEIRNRLFLTPLISCALTDSAEFLFTGDLEWTRSNQAPKDNLEFTFRNALLGWSHKGLRIKAGLQTFSIGRDLILYDDKPGLDAQYKKKHFVADAKAAFLDGASPLVDLGIAYQTTFFEHVRFFGTWFSDNDNSFAQALQNGLHPSPSTSRGDIFWYGVDFGWFLKKAYLSGVLIRQTGNSTLEWRHRSKSLNLSAYMLDLSLEYGLTDEITAQIFLFAASGDKKPRQGDFESFVALNPYNQRSAIFFNGGIDEPFSTDKLSLSGVTMAGVVAPGMKLSFDSGNIFSSELSIAALFPESRPNSKKDFYGLEADAVLTFHTGSKADFMIEVDYFSLGDFFKRRWRHGPSAVLNFIIGFDIYF